MLDSLYALWSGPAVPVPLEAARSENLVEIGREFIVRIPNALLSPLKKSKIERRLQDPEKDFSALSELFKVVLEHDIPGIPDAYLARAGNVMTGGHWVLLRELVKQVKAGQCIFYLSLEKLLNILAELPEDALVLSQSWSKAIMKYQERIACEDGVLMGAAIACLTPGYAGVPSFSVGAREGYAQKILAWLSVLFSPRSALTLDAAQMMQGLHVLAKKGALLEALPYSTFVHLMETLAIEIENYTPLQIAELPHSPSLLEKLMVKSCYPLLSALLKNPHFLSVLKSTKADKAGLFAYAAGIGHLELVEQLLQMGFDPCDIAKETGSDEAGTRCVRTPFLSALFNARVPVLEIMRPYLYQDRKSGGWRRQSFDINTGTALFSSPGARLYEFWFDYIIPRERPSERNNIYTLIQGSGESIAFFLRFFPAEALLLNWVLADRTPIYPDMQERLPSRSSAEFALLTKGSEAAIEKSEAFLDICDIYFCDRVVRTFSSAELSAACRSLYDYFKGCHVNFDPKKLKLIAVQPDLTVETLEQLIKLHLPAPRPETTTIAIPAAPEFEAFVATLSASGSGAASRGSCDQSTQTDFSCK